MGKKKQYSGRLGDCSEEQLQALAAFRKEVKLMGLSNPPYDDSYLLRFLRARKFDLSKTLTMFRNFQKWREDINIEELRHFNYPELNQVKKYFPHGYFRTDKEGRPILIECIGQLRYKEMMEVTTEERFHKYYIKCYEHLLDVKFPACSRAAGKQIASTFYIMDLKGGCMKLILGKVMDFVKKVSRIGQDNYPEVLGKMFIVNAPLVFYAVWNAIKPWIDERTKSKISILGSHFQKELLEYVDAENLPDFLGGKATVNEYGEFLTNEQGPWQDYEKEINWPDGPSLSTEASNSHTLPDQNASFGKKSFNSGEEEPIDLDIGTHLVNSDPLDPHKKLEVSSEEEDHGHSHEEHLYTVPSHDDHLHQALPIRLFHTKSMPVIGAVL